MARAARTDNESLQDLNDRIAKEAAAATTAEARTAAADAAAGKSDKSDTPAA